MAIIGCGLRPILGSSRGSQLQRRMLTTLQGNPHIYTFPNKTTSNSHILSLLSTDPPTSDLAIGITSKLPPSPDTFQENHRFTEILQEVVREHAHEDPDVKSQAQVMASTAGANLGSGGLFFAPQSKRKGPRYGGGGGAGGDSSGGASSQGGVGSGGRGGWVHVSDSRNPPDYGRIAWPEDIIGSVEVDAHGDIESPNGNYQPSGTYRILTRNGILGLSPFLRQKLVERLQTEEHRSRQ